MEVGLGAALYLIEHDEAPIHDFRKAVAHAAGSNQRPASE